MSTVILNYAGIALGVLGIVATIIFAVRYRERKAPSAYIANDMKVATLGAPPTLELSYRGKRIPTLTSTYVWFWNAGRRPIRREDIAPKQPIRITVGSAKANVEILDSPIVRKVTRDSIGFVANQATPNAVDLSFDFLDYQDGALIEIQHTGEFWTEAEISGVILGAPQGIKRWRRQRDVARLTPLLFGNRTSQWPEFRRDRMWRRAMLLVPLILMWLATLVLVKTSTYMSVTTEGMVAAIRDVVPAEQIPMIVERVRNADTLAALNRVAPYVFVTASMLVTIVMIWAALRPTLAMPETLVMNPEDKNASDTSDSSRTGTVGGSNSVEGGQAVLPDSAERQSQKTS